MQQHAGTSVTAPTLRIALFGRPSVSYGGVERPADVPPKTFALLAFVLLHPRRRVDRLAVASALWPDEPEPKALANVRRYLYRLTHELLPIAGEPWLNATARSIAWSESALARVDVDEFEAATTTDGVADLLDLYRGDLMESFDEAWLVPYREHYRECFSAALHVALTSDALSRSPSSIAVAKRLVAHDPLDELAARTLMLRRVESNDPIGALRDYDDFSALAEREYGVEPSAETRAIKERIVAELQADFRTDRDERLAALPAFSTPLFGRDAERNSVGRALARHPVVTLLGIGGIGKTRLAIDVVASVIDLFPDGAAFVNVARAEREDQLPSIFAEAIGVSRSSGSKDLEQRTIDALRSQRRIVLVDNCERHVDAVAKLLHRFVAASGESRFIVATRERLDLPQELIHRVRPLDRGSATTLFFERARTAETVAATNSTQSLVAAAVIEKLDGIPLALELAATRSAVGGLHDLASRLDQAIGLQPYRRGRPPRRKTMGAVLDWSHEQLDAPTARVFRNLSTFAGGWTLERARAAFGSQGADADAVGIALGELVDVALVNVDAASEPSRYRFLEPVRAYAAARLDADAAEAFAARERHARAALDAATAYVDAGRRLAMGTRVALAKAEIDDLRAAIRWTLSERHDVDLGRHLAAASMYLLFIAPDEGRSIVLEALETVDDGTPRLLVATLYHALSRFANTSLRSAEAYETAERAIDIVRSIGDDDALCRILYDGIVAAVGEKHLERAEALATECISIASSRGRREIERGAREFLPVIVSFRGDYDRARSLFLQSIEPGSTVEGDPVVIRLNFADNEYLAGRISEALRLNAEAIALGQRAGENYSVTTAQTNRCVYLTAAGRLDEARSLAVETIELCTSEGLDAFTIIALGTLADVAEQYARASEAATLAAYVRRRLAEERFVRDGAAELEARRLDARLRGRLDAEASKRAAYLAEPLDERAAIELAIAATIEPVPAAASLPPARRASSR